MQHWLDGLKSQACPSVDECIGHLGGIFPLLHDLRQTAQDAEWHGEGDVREHTGLVLEELYALLRQHEAIAGEQRQALILGALLHDIAKPLVSQETERDGRPRIVAPRHEVRGRSYCAFRIMELPLSYRVIHAVLTLIGEHNRPRRMVEDGGRNVFLRQSRIIDL